MNHILAHVRPLKWLASLSQKKEKRGINRERWKIKDADRDEKRDEKDCDWYLNDIQLKPFPFHCVIVIAYVAETNMQRLEHSHWSYPLCMLNTFTRTDNTRAPKCIETQKSHRYTSKMEPSTNICSRLLEVNYMLGATDVKPLLVLGIWASQIYDRGVQICYSRSC